MQQVSRNTKPGSQGNGNSEDRAASEALGWEVQDDFGCGKEYLKITSGLVDYVNKKVSVQSLFKKFNLHFEERYSPSGWTHRRTCPFPDHDDKTPSFNYNPSEGRFYCFGCNRGGRAVQLFAYLKMIPVSVAAQRLAEGMGNIEDIVVDLQNESQGKMDDALLDFSNSVRAFVEKHKSYAAMEFAEKVTWGLDLYLVKHVSRATMDESNLLARIQLLKEKLDAYSE